jgi:hypothetical protein
MKKKDVSCRLTENRTCFYKTKMFDLKRKRKEEGT